MNETAEERFARERVEDYKWWRDRTSFHPLSDWDKVMDDPSVILPSDGSYYIIANNIEEIKEFFYRIEDVDRWRSVGIIEDFQSDQWYDEEDDDEVFVVRVISEPKSLYYNQFFPVDERLQVRREEDQHDVYEIVFNENFLSGLSFPCLVQHSGQGDSDRAGKFEVNHCQILNLTGCPPREGPVKIQMEWI